MLDAYRATNSQRLTTTIMNKIFKKTHISSSLGSARKMLKNSNKFGEMQKIWGARDKGIKIAAFIAPSINKLLQ